MKITKISGVQVKVEGGALIYVLLVSLVVILLVLAMWSKFTVSSEIGSKNLRILQASNYFQNFDSLIQNGVTTTILEEYAKSDTTIFEIKPWGAWSIFKQSITLKKDTFERCFMLGSLPDNIPNLSVTNSSEGIGLLGNSGLVGWVELENPKVYPAFIGTQYFKGDKVLEGKITRLPESRKSQLFSETFYNNLQRHHNNVELDTLSYLDWIQSGEDSLFQSFLSSALVLHSEDKIILEECHLKGQIIIRSDVLVELSSSATLVDVLIVAPEIRIKSGTRFKGQLFATNSIYLEKQVECVYPSSICLLKSEVFDDSDKEIIIQEDSRINGYIISDVSNSNFVLEKGSRVYGFLESSSPVTLKGEVYGHLLVSEFKMRIKGGVYRNIIQDLHLKPMPFQRSAPFIPDHSTHLNYVQILG